MTICCSPFAKVKRNQVGVQLLSRRLHRQIFKNSSFSPPGPRFVRIAREHLEMHRLDPKSGTVLPNIAFALPPLQGGTIDEHFTRIGVHRPRPRTGLADDRSESKISIPPYQWQI